MESPNKVVIDTNMLLYIEKFNIDIFEEIKKLLGATEFFITKQVEFELSLKEKENLNLEKSSKIAKKIMEKNNVKIMRIEGENADKSLENASKKGFIVVTGDKELRKNIKGFGGKVIYLRKKKLLELDWKSGRQQNVWINKSQGQSKGASK